LHTPAERVNVSGAISADTVWSSNNLYVLTGGVTVAPGVTLTVQAGTVVKSMGPDLIVDGALTVNGSAGSPVQFTSYWDDSVGGDTDGDGGARPPAAADWNSVTFNAGSTGHVSNAVFSYGGGNYYYYGSKAEIRCYSDGVQIDSCTFRYSVHNGIYAEHAGIAVTNSTFGPGNVVGGITLWGGSPSTASVLTGNLFVAASGQAGLFLGEGVATKDVTLTNNRAQGACAFVIQGTTGCNIAVDNGSSLPILANLTVAAGNTLTFAPGTIVKSNGTMLDVSGTLMAQGTPAAPITFTSWWDDTVGGDSDGDAGTRPPIRGDWQAITFLAGSTGRISNAVTSYGGSNYWLYESKANIRCYSDDVRLDAVTFDHGNYSGLYVERAGIQLTGCTFGPDNAGWTLRVVGASPTAPLTATGNVFRGTSGAIGRISGDGATGKALVFQNNRAECPCAITLDGTTGSDVTWDNGSLLPLVVGMTVGPGTTFSLGAGSIVKANGADLEVKGTLLVTGTPSAPITFTSWWDDAVGGDTNGDGSTTVPAPANWNGITFQPGSHGRLTEAVVSYGGGNYWYYGSQAGVRCYSNDVELQSVKLQNNNNKGMYAEAGPRVRTSSITGNNYGIQNGSNRYWVDARGNWWGDASGPFHPVKNPAGKGQPVSDFVIFFPWAEDEAGTISTQANVYVEGPSWLDVGQTVEYAVTYETGPDPLSDAVLVASLPLTANPEDCGSGTYLQETGEVFWKLGALPPYSRGTQTLRITFMWGTPAHFPDGLGGLLLARGLNTGAYTFDLDRYLDYSAIPAGDPARMSEGEIQAELSSYPDVKTLHDRALSRGFTRLGGERQTIDGVPYTVLRLASFALGSVADVLRSQADDRTILRTHGPNAFDVEDATGAVLLDIELDSPTISGVWGAALESGTLAGHPTKGVAFRNCILQEAGMWALGKISKTFESVVGGYKCAKGLLTGDPGDIGDCLGLFDKVSKTIPIYGELKSIHTCYWDTIIGGQVDKYACNGSLTKVEPPVSSWNPISWIQGLPKRTYVRYTCDPTTQMWTLPETLYCPKGWIAQEGADDGEGHPCVPENDDVAFAYGYDAKKVPARTKKIDVRVGGDPNAKYGPAGDILASDTLSYTVACENVGDGTAYGVFITDTLSELFDDSTLSFDGAGSYSAGARMIFWDMGDLAPKDQPGSKGEVHLSVKLKPGTASGTTVTNQAVVYFPSVPEETPTNSVVNTVQTLIATPQELEMTAGGTLPVTLAGRSAEGGDLTFRVIAPPLYGSLAGSVPNLSYTPGPGFTGTDRFQFAASDGTSESSPAEVAVTVSPDPNDQTPPIVARTTPAAGQKVGAETSPAFTDETGPVYLPTVEVIFSEVVDGTTVTVDTVELRDPEGTLVNRSVAYDAQSKTCSISVRQPWSFGAFSATVKTGVKDLNGNALAVPYTWTFTTTSASGNGIPGDCDGSGTVSIGEVQKAINMFLGTLAPGCGVDCNGDGTVSIGEVQKVINGFLGLASSC
jgi:hypothetical protein